MAPLPIPLGPLGKISLNFSIFWRNKQTTFPSDHANDLFLLHLKLHSQTIFFLFPNFQKQLTTVTLFVYCKNSCTIFPRWRWKNYYYGRWMNLHAYKKKVPEIPSKFASLRSWRAANNVSKFSTLLQSDSNVSDPDTLCDALINRGLLQIFWPYSQLNIYRSISSFLGLVM